LKTIAALLLFCYFASAIPAGAEKFKQDDPILEDPDRELSVPQPTKRPVSKALDLLQNTFFKPGDGYPLAQNINTLGELPESSWFTNRMSRNIMSIEELFKGPNTGDGPDMSQPWIIAGAKIAGVTPGLRVFDAQGDMYFIKFDPIGWPQLATSTEVIGTKFFHALGYNVPENYLVYFKPEFSLDPDADITWPGGHQEKLSQAFVDDLLERVPRRPDGTIQAVASKCLCGKPIGPFRYHGTRSDDPNDIVLHQDRRELRALRIFCAWLNHNDSDSANSLDTYFTDEDGRGYVIHSLIDFGTVMGSGAVQPHARRVGNEHYVEFTPAIKSALTFGIWDRPWRHVDYTLYPAVGRFEYEYFRPEKWRPDYPNPAFDKMDARDALWATRSVMRFDDEAIKAIVSTGQIEDPAAAEHMITCLIKRRDKVIDHYLGQINPLDGFRVVAGGQSYRLEFTNLGLEAGLASRCDYDCEWYRFDNDTEELTLLAGTTASEPRIELPEGSGYLMARITSKCPDYPKWSSAVDVYVRLASTPTVVGIERALPADAM
jgi:hypothetical protein